MQRDEKLLKMRPDLNLEHKSSKPIETFQNLCLRPILKLQNIHTITLLKNHKSYHIETTQSLNDLQYRSFIMKLLQSDLQFKNQLLGMIIGLFTGEEMNTYLLHKKELNKRIMKMQLQRFVDQKDQPKIDDIL